VEWVPSTSLERGCAAKIHRPWRLARRRCSDADVAFGVALPRTTRRPRNPRTIPQRRRKRPWVTILNNHEVEGILGREVSQRRRREYGPHR
jgi:hypothetical protein